MDQYPTGVAYSDYISSYALVLEKIVQGVESNVYQRIGLAQVDHLWMKEG